MEDVTLREFLRVEGYHGYGDGYGDGSGFGNGEGYGDGNGYGDGCGNGYGSSCGDGYGDGSGYGSGYGDGNGDGSGYGDGNGEGIKAINSIGVYLIDGVETLICNVHANLVKGFILNGDLSKTPTFVVKQGNAFAHGETVKAARAALMDKLFEGMDVDERVESFVSEFKPKVPRPTADFYDWHHKLTGSCEQGRKEFARDHSVDMGGAMTPDEFIRLTEHAYGGEVISRLREFYGMEASE